MFFFQLGVETLTKAGKISFVILANKKSFTNFSQFLAEQSWSHAKLLQKVFMIYLMPITCIIKENLNPLPYVPNAKNDIDEIILV